MLALIPRKLVKGVDVGLRWVVFEEETGESRGVLAPCGGKRWVSTDSSLDVELGFSVSGQVDEAGFDVHVLRVGYSEMLEWIYEHCPIRRPPKNTHDEVKHHLRGQVPVDIVRNHFPPDIDDLNVRNPFLLFLLSNRLIGLFIIRHPCPEIRDRLFPRHPDIVWRLQFHLDVLSEDVFVVANGFDEHVLHVGFAADAVGEGSSGWLKGPIVKKFASPRAEAPPIDPTS